MSNRWLRGAVVGALGLGSAAGAVSCSSGGFDESLETNEEALCSPTTYEAETMTHSTGGAVTGGWNIWSNGFISTNHPFTAETTTVTVSARGEQGGGAFPHMIVRVGGVAIGNTTVSSSSFSDFSFTFAASAGTQELRVEFDNDACCTNGDRNLVIDKVTVSCSGGGTGGAGGGAGTSGAGGAGAGGAGAGGKAGGGGAGGVPPYKDPSQPVATRVSDLLSRMTLDEKLGQMAQSEQQTSGPADVARLFLGSVLSGADSTLNPPSASAWADLHDGYQSAAIGTRLGIPMLYGIDAVHGHAKVLGGTIFPHHLALGATRDQALVQQIGAITAQELTATGIRWTFAPALSVTRDQRWGRAYESFGEDPAIATLLASEVTGLQGTTLGAASNSVLATAKHFVGDGGAQWGTGDNPGGTPIDRGNAQLSDAALRAIHLAPYLNAVSRGVGVVMASFSSVNGTKMHANNALLTGTLKTELGFGGFVISDWQASDQLAGTFADQIRTAVNAGVDMFMLPNSYESFIGTLRSEVQAGRVTQARIDDAVSRIIRKKLELGLFEKPLADRSGAAQIGSSAHRDVARQAVRESLVLLKNTANFLPLSPTSTVCVTGNGADNLRAQVGAWTLGWQQPLTAPTGVTSVLNAVTQVVGASRVVSSGCQVGIRVVSETNQSYAEWMGDSSDPSQDGSGTCTATNGCVVVVLAGRPVNIQSFVNDASTKAIVMAWYPGSEGLGVTDVLFAVNGANFTGKLPVTWKVDATDTPVNWCDAAGTDADHDGTPDACQDTGAHYSSSASPPASVLFPYGFGLSYGTSTPTCSDGVKNGTETDVDCGGTCATHCADGKLCSIAADCSGNSCVSGTCCAVLPAPSGLTGTPGNGQASLAWSAVAGAESYNVKRSTTSGSGFATVMTSTAPSAVNGGLTNGTQYFFVTSAVNQCAAVSTESASSSQISVTPSGGGSCTPTTAGCEFQMAGGVVSVEAEHFFALSTAGVTTGDAWSLLSAGAASGGQALTVGPDNGSFWTTNVTTTAPRVEFKVSFSAGTFFLHVRGDASNGAADSCWGGLDGVQSATVLDYPETAGSWAWRSLSLGSVAAGIHNVHIWGREDGFRFDKLVISTSSTAPTGAGPPESVLN